MNFVNERISEADKKSFDFEKIKIPPTYRQSTAPSVWTIDHEANVFLVWTKGGDEDNPHCDNFALWWHGNVVYAVLRRHNQGNIKTHIEIRWELENLILPKELEAVRQEVVDSLKEALKVFKVIGVLVPVASCSVTFDF